MASDIGFVDFVCEQVGRAGAIESKKMFGEYLVYCDGRPALLVCDNQVFVKILPETTALFAARGRAFDVGLPYKGAKEHYVLDMDDADFATETTGLLARMPPPDKKNNKK